MGANALCDRDGGTPDTATLIRGDRLTLQGGGWRTRTDIPTPKKPDMGTDSFKMISSHAS